MLKINEKVKELVGILFWDINAKITLFILFLILSGVFHYIEYHIGTMICVALAFLNLGQFIAYISVLWLETNETRIK